MLVHHRLEAVVGGHRGQPQHVGDVQQLGAVDSMTVRSTEGRETLLKLALPAPQGSGNADETGQAGGCEAAERLPGGSEAQDPRLASFENDLRRCSGLVSEEA